MNRLPPHIVKQYGSSRAFKARKRALIRNLEAVFNELNRGSAWMPCAPTCTGVGGAIIQMKALCSVKNWGR